MKKKHTNKEIKEMQNWLKKLFSNKSMWGIIYNDMKLNRKDPFGKDIDLFFNKLEKMRDVTNKNPIIQKLYKDVVNYRTEVIK